MKRSERTVGVRDLRCKNRERKRERNADWAVKKRRDSNKTKPPSLSVSEICVITKWERERESVCSEVVIVVCVIRWGNRCLRWWEPHAIYFHTCLCRPCARATDASRHSHITVHFFFSRFHDKDRENKSSGLGTVYSKQHKSSQEPCQPCPRYASFAFLNSTLNAYTF